jgi:hypothetical protein
VGNPGARQFGTKTEASSGCGSPKGDWSQVQNRPEQARLLLAWPVGFLRSVPRWLVSKVRKLQFRPVWETPLGKPLRYIVAILINSLFIYLLLKPPPFLYRVYFA